MIVSTIASMIIFTKKKRKKNIQIIKDINIRLKQELPPSKVFKMVIDRRAQGKRERARFLFTTSPQLPWGGAFHHLDPPDHRHHHH